MTDGVVFHTQVALDNMPQKDFHFTCNLAAGITTADIGKALSVGAAANTFKLAANNDMIAGRLNAVESRATTGQLLGVIAMKFIEELPVKVGEVVVLGGSVVGAGVGEIKPAAVSDPTDNYVIEVRSGFAVVVKL